MHSYCCACALLNKSNARDNSIAGAKVDYDGIIRGINCIDNDDHDSNNKSFQNQAQKTIANKDIRSSGMHEEGGEGIDLWAHERASLRKEAQTMESSQNVMAPSPSNTIASIEIQVQRTRYVLLEIDGFLMWQFFVHSEPIKDHIRLTIKSKMHYFLDMALKNFWNSV